MAATSLPFSLQLAAATGAWHKRAEKSGIMPALLRGTLPRNAYSHLLRNFEALYSTLEAALDAHAATAVVAPIWLPELYRTDALRHDLATLAGPQWPALPVAAAMTDYVRHVGAAAHREPALLAAHAYVRYMGDLSGGQMLQGIVARMLATGNGGGTAFYRFERVPDVAATKARFRAGLDALPLDEAAAAAVTAEAVDAFARHVELFEELATTVALPRRN